MIQRLKHKGTYLITLPDGTQVEYPATTKITGQYDKSAPLMGWVAKLTVNYMQEFKDEDGNIHIPADKIPTFIKDAKAKYKRDQSDAMKLGSDAHNCIEVYLKRQPGQRPYINLIKIEPRLEPIMQAFFKWEEDYRFKLKRAEHPVYSLRHKYAGTLDAVGHINDRLYLLDFKTSGGIYRDYLWQVAAYHNAYEEMSGEHIEGVGILRLAKVEPVEFEWKEYTLDEIGKGFEIFKDLCRLWWTRTK